jgi:hypothetical protein
MAKFYQYYGIDYSGAGGPHSRLSGLRVFRSYHRAEPKEVSLQGLKRRNWTRVEVAAWLRDELSIAAGPVLVGLDHAFSFPLAYFEKHDLPHHWTAFMDDFQAYWPTDIARVRDCRETTGRDRSGESRWYRLTESYAKPAKSVFHFDVSGTVANSSHAGIPWLRWLRRELGDKVHFWPFDGWLPPSGVSVIAEVYPRLWNRRPPKDGHNQHQHDAYTVAHQLQMEDQQGGLPELFCPNLTEVERKRAGFEGWILGVTGKPPRK